VASVETFRVLVVFADELVLVLDLLVELKSVVELERVVDLAVELVRVELELEGMADRDDELERVLEAEMERVVEADDKREVEIVDERAVDAVEDERDELLVRVLDIEELLLGVTFKWYVLK
jgi:hypothetical protein